MFHHRAANVKAALLLAALVLAAPGGAARAALPGGYPALFGSQETVADTLSLFPKWQGAVTRFFFLSVTARS